MATATRRAAQPNRAPRTRQQWAILRRVTAARRHAPVATPAGSPEAGLAAACLAAAGFADHRAHYA